MTQIAWALRRAVHDGFDEVVAALVVEGFLTDLGDQTREHTLYARTIA
jgi:hypothetical protein